MTSLTNPQPLVNARAIEKRYRVAKAYLKLTRALAEIAYPEPAKSRLRSDRDLLMVLIAVFIGDVEGRPMTVAKLADFVELPRASVYRRLATLLKIKKIVRDGRFYYYAPNAMLPDRFDRICNALEEFDFE